MRVYLFGIPGNHQFEDEFKARLKLLTRILEKAGHEVFNVFENDGPGRVEDKDGRLIRYKNIKDDYDALVFEVSTEINPKATISLIADLTADTGKPVRILRALFFKIQYIDSRGDADEFQQKFMFREGQRLFIYYNYNSDPKGFNDPKNNELKTDLRDLGRGQISREHEVTVLAGIGAERRV